MPYLAVLKNPFKNSNIRIHRWITSDIFLKIRSVVYVSVNVTLLTDKHTEKNTE